MGRAFGNLSGTTDEHKHESEVRYEYLMRRLNGFIRDLEGLGRYKRAGGVVPCSRHLDDLSSLAQQVGGYMAHAENAGNYADTVMPKQIEMLLKSARDAYRAACVSKKGG